ncbi:hypothetical protein J6590_065202 [Homalodisca vitripennis]|nr:hypothetical protein J6590_065202 [Homalodisca vitripennis]
MLSSVQGTIDVPPSCLRCLCEAVSGGPSCVYGAVSSCHDGVCGPYAITLPYWQDAGRPTVGLEDRLSDVTYQKCALDTTCSEATIRGYMNRFHQDCNSDGVEDCFDYTAIHMHGGYSCNQPLAVSVRNVLANCLQREGPGDPAPGPFNPVPAPVTPFPYPLPEEPEEHGNVEDNDVVYPKHPTTFPSIDVRLGDD